MLNKKLRTIIYAILLTLFSVFFVFGLSSSKTPLINRLQIHKLIQESEDIFYDICWKIKFKMMYNDVDDKAKVQDLDYKEERIILVDIDETSLKEFGSYGTWPRTYHGTVVNELTNQGAAAIAFDILFKEGNFGLLKTEEQLKTLKRVFPDRNWEIYRSQFNEILNEDSVFIKNIRESESVIVAATASPFHSYPDSALRAPLLSEFRRLSISPHSGFENSWTHPEIEQALLDNIFTELAEASQRMGLVNVIADADGVHRREPLFWRFPLKEHDPAAHPKLYPILSLQTVLFVMGQSPDKIKIKPGEYANIGKPLGLYKDSLGVLKTTYPHLSGAMIKEVIKNQALIKQIGPLKENLNLVELTAPIKAYIEDEEIKIDIFNGQTIEGDLLNYLLENPKFDSVYFSFDKSLEDEFELNTQFSLYYDNDDEILYLKDKVNEEELYFNEYSLNTLRENQEVLNHLSPDKSLFLSGNLKFKWNREFQEINSSYIILNPDVLNDLFEFSPDSFDELLAKTANLDTLRFGKEIKIPIDEQGRVLINYRGKYNTPSNQKTFRTISYSKLLKKAISTSNDGAIYVLGSTAAALFDQVAAPDEKVYPGVYIHMNLMENFLNNRFIEISPIKSQLLVGACFALSISLLVLSIGPLWSSIITLIMGISYFFFVISQFFHGIYWGVILVEMILILGFLFSTMIRYIFEEKEKRRIKDSFKQYISPEMIEQLLASGGMPSLGGTQGYLTAYFTDIAGFSTFSEKIGSAEKLVELLNEYLTDMTDILGFHKGTLDKYEGDAIIAFFGAPLPLENHALSACKSALAMQNKLIELRKRWATQGDKWPLIVHQMRMRIGINSGDIVTGNMGSTMRKNYTMMGDAVNLAARLESGAKQYGVFTLCSEETLTSAGKEHFYTRQIDRVKVMGKSEPVVTYELLALREEPNENHEILCSKFERAKTLYQEQNWAEAIAIFEECLELEPFHPEREVGCKTTPSHVFIERCKEFQLNPPVSKGEIWDGVYVASEK